MADDLRIDPGDAIVLDVVAPGVWEELDVSVPGALRIDPREMERRVVELPPEKAVVAYCT